MYVYVIEKVSLNKTVQIRILNLQLQHGTSTSTSSRIVKRVSLPLVAMALVAFMNEQHTKVYSGYDHQSNIGMMSALLLGWNRVLNQHKMVDNLKQQPRFLI